MIQRDDDEGVADFFVGDEFRDFRDGHEARADSLLLGAFAAVLATSNLLPCQSWLKKVLPAAAIVSGLGLLIIATPTTATPWQVSMWSVGLGWSLDSIFGMVLVLYAALPASSEEAAKWILGNSVLVYIGQISYGIYIWHFPILMALQQFQLPWRHLAYLVPVFPIVLISYYLIERPCLHLKSRFH